MRIKSRRTQRKHSSTKPAHETREQRIRRLLDPSVGFEEAYCELNDSRNHATPQSVIEAVIWCVRERGVAALDEPKNLERLERCDEAARAQINGRIKKIVSGGTDEKR
jgi:hypothetical protein